MLAVANPKNDNFPMPFLVGSIEEVKTVNDDLNLSPASKDIALEHFSGSLFKPKDIATDISQYFPNDPEIILTQPTEKWLRDNLASNKYEIIYFATHGQAQSDTVTKIEDQIRLENDVQDAVTREKSKKIASNRQVKAAKAMRDNNLSELTPLNGFLYLSNLPEDQLLDSNLNLTGQEIPKERDGLLTIGEILELDEKKFDETKFILLSACNAAVSLVPFAIGENYDQTVFFDKKRMQEDLAKYGFLDGVDQVTFVESFMKKGVPNIYASYWQLDDMAAKAIMSQFWKIVAHQKDNVDLVKAYSEAQKNYLAEAKKKMREKKEVEDMHPYYWAAGAMFGK